MRDHTKLRAFTLADDLAVQVYRITRNFPKEEQFGITSQMRRGALSIPSNIVEGCARDSELEYLHFLDIAYGSARELQYQISLAHRLGYLRKTAHDAVYASCTELTKVLNGLIRSLRRP
ncbi:MAG TPA: four helix bundle protein [Planctomycetota bacterium]|nr:four helix bundle protein [Planctomycetota bacterium]HUV38869.1 four helix bundle protein [Planctomycetota bacterium]